MKIRGKTVHIGDLIWVKWEDHWGSPKGTWIDRKKVDLTPILCETVGWVIGDDGERIATTQSHDGQGDDPFVHGSYSVCPKRMIVDIQVLKKGNKKLWNT